MSDLRRHPLTAALAAAALVQALLLLLVRAPATGRPPVRTGESARSDTAELLNLSRRVAPAAQTPLGLNNLLSLPLPPPPPPPPAELGMPVPPSPQPSGARPTAPAPRPPASSSTGVAPPPVPGLPSQPGPALELARAVAEGAASALPNDGATQAMAAVQRRQWWLDPAQQRQLQRAWEQAESAPAPEAWGELPSGLQVRRLAPGRLGSLAGGDARGRSLVSRQQLTLLWIDGEELWLLRLPLA